MATGSVQCTAAAIQQLDSNANFTTDILSDALTCTATKFFKGMGSDYTGTVPNNLYKYGTFMVTVRDEKKHIIAHAVNNNFAINTYNGSSWTGWRELIALTDITLSAPTSVSLPFTAPHAGILRVFARAQVQGRVYVIFDSGEMIDGYQAEEGYVINNIPIQKGKTLTISDQSSNVLDISCVWYEFNF